MRLIDEAGANLGLMSLSEALKTAEERALDLILIVPTATPPIAKVMSFDKFRFLRDKELKKQRQAQKAPEMKQIQISVREAKNDLLMKIGRLEKFLKGGHKVEIALRLRGREKAMRDWAKGKMEEFMKLIPFQYKLSQSMQFDGKQYTLRIDPVQ